MDLLTKIWAETDRGEVSEIKREAYKDKYIYTPNFEKTSNLMRKMTL